MVRLSDLQRKDIIDLNSGKMIGRIIDVEINEKDGSVIGLIIERNKRLKNLFNNEEDTEIKYAQIKKMGEDVILVDKS